MRVGWRHVSSSTAGTLVGNCLSLALPFVVTAWFATGTTTDVFFYALGAILFLNVAISVALESATTPLVVALLAGGGNGVRELVRRVQIQGALVCAGLTVVGIGLFNFVLVSHSGFDTDARAQVRDISFLLGVLPVLVSWNAPTAGALYAHKIFAFPTASVGLRTVFALASGLVLRGELGIMAIPVGLIAGEAVRVIVLEKRFRRAMSTLTGPPTGVVAVAAVGSKRFWRAAGPQSLSMSLSGISPVVDKTVAIGVGAGGVTILELSQRLVYAPVLLLLSGVGIVLGARWSEQFARSNWAGLISEYQRARRAVFGLGAVIVLVTVPLVFLLRSPARAGLSITDPSLLAWTFSAAAIGIPFALASQVSVRLLLVMGETRLMPILTVCAIALNVGLDLALVAVLGLPGIALASAVVNVFNAVAYSAVAKRHLRLGSRRSASDASMALSASTETGESR